MDHISEKIPPGVLAYRFHAPAALHREPSIPAPFALQGKTQHYLARLSAVAVLESYGNTSMSFTTTISSYGSVKIAPFNTSAPRHARDVSSAPLPSAPATPPLPIADAPARCHFQADLSVEGP